MDYGLELKNFLDSDGRLNKLPSKHKNRVFAAFYIAEKVSKNVVYNEKEINAEISKYHSFNDAAAIRREMVDLGLLMRDAVGREYRIADSFPALSEFGFGDGL